MRRFYLRQQLGAPLNLATLILLIYDHSKSSFENLSNEWIW